MAFCIMRMDKKKSSRDVVMTIQHNTRERMPDNADPEKSKKNWVYGGNTLETIARFGELTPDKIRSNAVQAVELVMTASPEFSGPWADKKAADGTVTVGYLNACDKWAKEIFGKENLLHVAHHWDETTPHTHIVFVPLKDGKLNAKSYIGGHRNRMKELQEDFYQKVGKPFGLDRGKPREETRAKHTHHKMTDLKHREEAVALAALNLDTVQRMGAVVIKAMKDNQITEPEIKRFWPAIENRLPEVVSAVIAADREKYKVARNKSQELTQGKGR